MNYNIKLALLLGASLFVISCGGGGSTNTSTPINESNQSETSIEKPNESENNDNNYTDDIDLNEYDDYSGNDYDGGESIGLDSLAGYGVSNSDGRYIAFCSDNESYYYLNANSEEESGTFSLSDDGNQLNFNSSDGASYTMHTSNGYLETDKIYDIGGFEEFLVNEVVPSGC